MDIHELEAFIALAESMHFAKAAIRIHLSPSALSRLLARLEEEIGVPLLERDTRQVSLTPEGEDFLAFARETVHRRDDLLLRVAERDDRLRGILRVYASVTACYSILPPLVSTLAREHPDLKLSVETGDPANAANAVREGRAELALDALPPGGFPDLDAYLVRNTPLVFVSSSTGAFADLSLPRDRMFAERARPSPRERPATAGDEILLSQPLILPKTGLARERLDRWARARGAKPNVAAETSGNEAVLALARLGLGLGLVPRLVLENGPFAEGLVVYEAGSELGSYDIGFVQKKVDAGTEAARRFRRTVADIIKRTYPHHA